ncbi:MAG: TIGR00730 family Rossman fold protein [Gammaproteobacteria bacterium]|nr:TIGR00730 family Rossman fold protein [Gammaproteobacteria bacterium]
MRSRPRFRPDWAMRRVCVYCGSNVGARQLYADAARELAEVLVRHDLDLVYGGADKGLMGVLANTVLERGGKVHGVIPKLLCEKEIAHEGLTELHVVSSMHARKSMMAALSDGFIAMPGGFGTLEEIIEIITWGQLRFHDKPCGLLNVGGYFDHLLGYLDHAQREGFLRPENRQMLLCDRSATGLIQKFEQYTAPHVEKWIR